MKKIKYMSSAVAGLLLCVMLLSSCALFPKKEESPYIEGQRLSVETVEIEYTDSEMAEIVLRLTNIAGRLAFLRDGLVLTEKEKSELGENINDIIEEVTEYSGIGYGVALKLLDSVEKRLSDDEEELSASLLSELYLLCIGGLGRERGAKLIYSASVACLDRRSRIFRERYEKYGYQWYLDDAERYAELSSEIREEIGYERLADAMGVFFFSTSLLSGMPAVNNEGGFVLDNAELLLLLDRQASYLADNTLTNEQWQTVFEVYFELYFAESDAPRDFDEVEREEYLALRNNREYAPLLGGIMPYVTNLYVAFVNRLSGERLGRLMSSDRSVARLEFLNTLYLCKNEFLPLAARFSSLRFDSEHEKNALIRADVYEDYLIYEKYRKATSGADLYNAIGNYLRGSYSKAQLDGVFENYMFSSAPYYTYVFIFDNRK